MQGKKRLTSAERLATYGDPTKKAIQRGLITQRILLGESITSRSVSIVLHPIWAQGLASAVVRVGVSLQEWPTEIQSYNVRKIAGSNDWSVHSWALGVDVFTGPDGVIDPVTERRTMSPDWFKAMESECPAFWGGRFRRKDPHHLEYPW